MKNLNLYVGNHIFHVCHLNLDVSDPQNFREVSSIVSLIR